MKLPGKLTVLRDASTFGLGVAIMLQQAGILFTAPSRPSEALITAAMVLITGTGAAQFFDRFRGTKDQSSQQVEAQPSPQQSLPRGNSGGDK